MRAARATDLARATPRPSGGDGDGPLADGRTPVECRAHCASSTGRQRHLARVEPVGCGGANGGGVALRPPFTPRRLAQRARNETARGEAAEGGTGWRARATSCQIAACEAAKACRELYGARIQPQFRLLSKKSLSFWRKTLSKRLEIHAFGTKRTECFDLKGLKQSAMGQSAMGQ